MTILKTIQTVLKDYTPRLLQDDGSTQGAVIVPLFQREGQIFVLLTKRTENLSIHKGQISFPGGKKEPNDKTIFHCALRETLEEIGIPPEKIALLGALDQLKTFGSNVLLTPFVCEVAFPFELKPNSGEVEEVIEETYPHPPGYPYEISEEKSKEGIALKDYISALNEVLSDILDQLNEFKTSQKSVEEIDKRLKNIENTPEFETEDEPKVKIKMASPIRIRDGMVYRR